MTAERIHRFLVVAVDLLILGAGTAWAERDVEMQIEWDNSAGTLVALGTPAGPAAGAGGTVFVHGFELGWGDWSADNGVWQIGKPTSGPSEAYQGECVAGTNLSGNYPFNTDSRLISPAVVLPSPSDLLPGEVIELRFYQWFSYAANCPDHGRVEIQTLDPNGWSAWVSLGVSADEASAGWSRTAKDLTQYAGKVVRIAFCHDDVYDDPYWSRHYESAGWYIDEVEVWHGVPEFVSPEGFELGWGDWSADNGVWQIGKPTSGPSAAYQGECVAGTNLSGDYPFNTDSRLIMPTVVLPSLAQLPLGQVLELRFYQWFSYAANCPDHGRVEIQTLDPNGWSVWKSLGASADEASAGWSRTAKDLTQYAGKVVRIAFCHDDVYDDPYWSRHYESAGWYIDDVEIHGLVQPPVLSTWSVSVDTGISSNDRLTNDTTPAFAFVFSKPVRGTKGDIEITEPDGTVVTPDLISGWDTDTVVAAFATPLEKNGQYGVTLKKTIKDTQGMALSNGVDQIVHFTLDTVIPVVTIDALATGDTTPKLTGTIDDLDATVEATVDGWDYRNYPAVNNRNGTWALPDGTISPPLEPGVHQVVVFATDRAGNVGFDFGLDSLNITGLRISYRQMQHDAEEGQSCVEVFITNNSSMPLQGNLCLVVKGISEPSVVLANANGKTAEGDSYVNLMPLLGNAQLDPDETIVASLTFNNPQQERFTATVVVHTMP